MKKLSLVLCLMAALTACQKKTDTAKTPDAASSASAAASASAQNASATVPAAESKPAPFDLQSVPVSTANLPAFPYLDYPEKLERGYRSDKKPQFDEVYLIAGKELRRVEGQVLVRHFPHTSLNMSALESQRNYENLIKSLGGVKVSQLMPADAEFKRLYPESEDQLEKKMRVLGINNGGKNYQMYLLRTPQKNIWFGLSIYDNDSGTWLMTVEEKAFEQTVSLTKAEVMADDLKKSGEVTLYLAFDTDSASIKEESKPVLAEIAKLLKNDQSLQLKVEGHTDNQGTAAHNKKLSESRAQSVMQAVTALGIDAKRLQAAGYGQDKPVADNATEAGRAKNRRVMLVKAN
jgi:outer membrane protein OmpA-like peptidoglycan-associated protein